MGNSICQSHGHKNPQRKLHPHLPVPTNLDKVINQCNHYKWLCTSSQGQLPDRGITCTYAEECSRIGQNSEIFKFLQCTFHGSKTQQLVDTYLGPQYSEQISEDREIQNGNTRNYKDLPSSRGVGDTHRLHGHLLPRSNTQPVEEISMFSYSRSILPSQSTTLWSVYISHGIHGSGEGGQTDGFTLRYKHPLVPR